MYVLINTDKRFVVPNRKLRIGERTEAARPRSAALRELFDDRPLVLTTPGSVNWITGGLSDPIDVTTSSDPVWVVESQSGRALVTSEIEGPRLAGDFDLAALGWNLITVPWFDADAQRAAVTDFADVAPHHFLSDREGLGQNVTSDVVRTRMVLSAPEQDDLRSLGALVGFALAQGVDAWSPGRTKDFEVAAVVSATLERFGATAVCLIVGGDDRLRSIRHPLALGDVLHDAMMVVVVARRGGLHVAATRTAVRWSNDPIIDLVHQLGAVHERVLRASLPGGTWGEAVDELGAGYEFIGHGGAWREHFQGGPIAFEQREFEMAPGQKDSPYWDVASCTGTAVAWNPSLRGGAKIEETYLVRANDVELVTVTDGWPLTTVGAGPQHSDVKVVQ